MKRTQGDAWNEQGETYRKIDHPGELNQNNECINIATVQYLETLDASSTFQQNAAFSRKKYAPMKIFSHEAIDSLT